MLRLSALLLLCVSLPAQAQPQGSFEEMARNPVITVRISENLRKPPDEAILSVSTQSRAPTASAALETNKAKTEKLVEAIRRAGIGDKDIQTEGVNINPDYRYHQVAGRGESHLIGYVASNSVRIKTRALDRLSNLLDTLASAGADQVYGPNFAIADPAPLRRESRKRAMERGQAEATEYAVNAGFSRVRLLSVEEGISSRSTDIIVTASRQGGAPPPPPPPPAAESGGSIQLGQIETGVSLALQYRMER